MATLFEKLENIETKYDELTQQLSSPEILNDSARFQKLAKTAFRSGRDGRKVPRMEANREGTGRVRKQMVLEAEDAEMKQMAAGRREATAEPQGDTSSAN